MDLRELPAPLVGPGEGRDSKYEWRGFMLDSARTCHSVESIKSLLRLLGRYGFNRFHWHLSDDQGWRFAVPGYPLLTEEAAWRERDDFERYDSLWEDTLERGKREAPGRWTNGWYRDEEIAEIVALAEDLGIEIVPELDFPGHMSAAIAAYPEIGRPASSPLPEGSMRKEMFWPALNDLLWPNQAAADLIEAALARLVELFPGRYVHIGGDECVYRQWETDPGLEPWMREHGISDGRGIHRWFLRRGAKQLQAAGRTPVVWDEAADLVGEDVVVTAWGQGRDLEHQSEGGQPFVICGARYLYLNRVDPDGGDDQKGMVPPISVTDILTAPFAQLSSPECLGLQTCLWSEFVLDHRDLMSMVFPRVLAVAARLWSSEDELADTERVAELVEREYQVVRPALG